MRYAILTTILIFVASALAIGQGDAAIPEQVTMCELYKNPKVHAGKIVQFRSSVTHWDSRHFWLDDFGTPERCDAYMRLVTVFPRDVSPPPSFQFLRDESWRQFAAEIRSQNVEATFVGVFQPYFVWRDHKRFSVADDQESRKEQKYDGQLVLLRLSDVVARPVARK